MNEAFSLELVNARLSTASDLRSWLEREEEVGPADTPEVSLRLEEFVSLRSSIRDLLDASMSGRPMPPTAVARVNEASARVPRVLRLEEDGSTEVALAGSATPLVLSRIAWSAIELLGGPQRSRLRRCGACERYFVTTRSDRRWCSDACGNRTRVARYHERRRNRT